MKVGQQPVDRLEAIARGDEDCGVAVERADRAIVRRRAFDQAERGGPDRDQPPAPRSRCVEAIGGGSVDPAPFGMHPMVGGVVDLDRQEGPGADVKRQRLASDPPRVDRLDQPLGEVERGGRCCNRTGLAGEHRLIVGSVVGVGRSFGSDVGRERHLAGSLEQQFDRLLAVEGQENRPSVVALDRGGLNPETEVDDVPIAHPFGVADERPPAAQSLALVQGCSHPRVTARPFKLGGDDLGVVEHQHIVGAEQRRQVEHGPVAYCRPIDRQQPRRIARSRWPERDAVGRQVEVE